MNHFPVLLLRNLHAPCASQARACVLCAKLLQCCCPRTWPARDPGRMQTLSSHFTLHQNWENLLTNHFRSLDAAIPIRFTIFSCKRQKYYACSRCAKQPWRSHYNAICRDWVAKHNRTTCNGVGNCSSKTGSRRQSDKKTILKHFLKGILKGKLLAPKLRKSADKSLSQPWCSRSNTIYDLQLQKTIVLRMQPLHQATLTQPLQCDLQRLSCKTQ